MPFLFLFTLFSFLAAASAGPIGSIPRTMSPARRDSPKYVVAHHMVGNTYPYQCSDWLSDINLAHKYGIDAFALNVGRDPWQATQVSNAYQAALQSGTGFKLFLSFDMTSLPCASADDAAALRDYITTYASHPNQLIYNGRVFASAFSGQSCMFGQSSAQKGWSTQFVQQLSGANTVQFVPAFFVGPSELHSFSGVINGLFTWNTGWPTDLTSNSVPNYGVATLDALAPFVGATKSDMEYIDALSIMDGCYVAPVSPWFFTHYSPQTYNKNWIYLSDDHLYVRRWEHLIGIRDQIDIVQIISFNDYGESHYIGPIEGAQPNSEQWVDGFDHSGWLKMTKYYATAFKTGVPPPIPEDQIFMWSRPHPTFATAPDPVGPPNNHQLAQDRVWVVVFACSEANVILSTSPTMSETFAVPAGVTKLSLPIAAGGYMKAVLQRDDQTIINLQPENFTFNPHPPSYNFNAFVVSS